MKERKEEGKKEKKVSALQKVLRMYNEKLYNMQQSQHMQYLPYMCHWRKMCEF